MFNLLFYKLSNLPNAAFLVNIWMINWSFEGDFWRLERVLDGKLDDDSVGPFVVRLLKICMLQKCNQRGHLLSPERWSRSTSKSGHLQGRDL